jgi:hypothetical protein
MTYADTDFHIVITRGAHFAKFDNDKPFENIQLDGKKHEVRIVIPHKQKTE